MKKIAEEIQELLNLYKLKKLSAAEVTANNLIHKYSQNVWLYNILGLILTDQKKILTIHKKVEPPANPLVWLKVFHGFLSGIELPVLCRSANPCPALPVHHRNTRSPSEAEKARARAWEDDRI